MVRVDALFSRDELAAAIDAGHVRTQTHPDLPLRIFNYTEKCAYDGIWNEVTLQCRGLIREGLPPFDNAMSGRETDPCHRPRPHPASRPLARRTLRTRATP